jgi:hypothetical protein
MGTDLAAQVARGSFVAAHGLHPIDFRWYGGVNQFGYSLVTPALMALIGARWLGAISAVAFAAVFAAILVRTGARRPRFGGILGAVIAVGNVASGRVTFAAGLAIGATALLIAIAPADWDGSGGDRNGRRWPRRLGAASLAVLTTVTSPVAGLFLGIAVAAWLIGGLRSDPAAAVRFRLGTRWPDAVGLGGGAALGLIPIGVFADGGRQPFTGPSMWMCAALAAAVGLLVMSRYRALQVGAALAVALLLFAYFVPTAIGSNALRLPMLFGVPVLAAYGRGRPVPLVAVLAALAWWQPPVMWHDIAHSGAPETRASFYQPLLAELATLGPLGRIEVVPLRDHWESVFVADVVPLARGWLRQVDAVRNPLFYQATPVTAAGYGAWLRANAVAYVAWSPDQPLDVYGRSEAAVIGGGPAYLTEVWRDAHWRLFRVIDPQPLVTGGALVAVGPATVAVDVPAPGPVTVRVRWSRWLTVTGGGCPRTDPDGWTTFEAAVPGRYTISSGLRGNGC